MEIHGNSGPAQPEFPEEIRERQGERERLFHYFSFGCDATSFSRPLPQIGSSGCSSRRPSATDRLEANFFPEWSLGHTSCLAATSLSPNLPPSRNSSFFETVSAAPAWTRRLSLKFKFWRYRQTETTSAPDSGLILPQFSSPVAMGITCNFLTFTWFFAQLRQSE